MILIISSDHIPHIGGKSTHILDLIAGMKANGSDVELYSQAQFSNFCKKTIKLAIGPVRLFSIDYFQYLYSKIWRKILCNKVKKLYIKLKPTCISCQDAFAASSLEKIRNLIDCPIVLTMHTYFGLENALDCKSNRIKKTLYEKNLQYELKSLEVADKIIAVDSRILNHVKDIIENEKCNRKIRVSKCLSIVNFTNIDVFSPGTTSERSQKRKELGINDDAFVILCARRLVEKNGVIYAVDAMKYTDDNTLLLIAGDGPQYNNIKKAVQDMSLESKVILLGSVPSNQIVNLYKMADCSLVPSITVNGLQEATSISALEAMSCGLPTIASNIGGLKQIIIDKESGILVDEKESLQISNAITYLRKNENEKQAISIRARQYVIDNYSHIKGAAKYLTQFNSQ